MYMYVYACRYTHLLHFFHQVAFSNAGQLYHNINLDSFLNSKYRKFCRGLVKKYDISACILLHESLFAVNFLGLPI